MDDDPQQPFPPAHDETVMWHAAIAGYWIVCSVTTRPGEGSTIEIVENGRTLTCEDLEPDTPVSGAQEVARRLFERYASRATDVANRIWRFGGAACLTTSWSGGGATEPDVASTTEV